MRRRGVLAFALYGLLLLGLGCTAEYTRQWAEALKDLRGENMEFGSHPPREPLSPPR
jgi:hypothetical protein